MNSSEREPVPTVSLFEAVGRLRENEGFLLSHNQLQLVKDVDLDRVSGVTYDALNAAPEILHPPARKLVTHEFFEAAKRLVAGDKYIKESPAYPVLSVINHDTGAVESRVIDVAELIVQDVLPIYSMPARVVNGGELLMADLSQFTKNLAQEVGCDPETAVVVSEGRIMEFKDALPITRTYLRKENSPGADIGHFDMDPRGEATLNFLQMNVARAFNQHASRNQHISRGIGGVELEVMPRPDIKSMILGLIYLVQSYDLELYLTKDEVLNSEECFIFMIVNKEMEEVAGLSADTSLTAAVHDAFTALQEILPKLKH